MKEDQADLNSIVRDIDKLFHKLQRNRDSGADNAKALQSLTEQLDKVRSLNVAQKKHVVSSIKKIMVSKHGDSAVENIINYIQAENLTPENGLSFLQQAVSSLRWNPPPKAEQKGSSTVALKMDARETVRQLLKEEEERLAQETARQAQELADSIRKENSEAALGSRQYSQPNSPEQESRLKRSLSDTDIGNGRTESYRQRARTHSFSDPISDGHRSTARVAQGQNRDDSKDSFAGRYIDSIPEQPKPNTTNKWTFPTQTFPSFPFSLPSFSSNRQTEASTLEITTDSGDESSLDDTPYDLVLNEAPLFEKAPEDNSAANSHTSDDESARTKQPSNFNFGKENQTLLHENDPNLQQTSNDLTTKVLAEGTNARPEETTPGAPEAEATTGATQKPSSSSKKTLWWSRKEVKLPFNTEDKDLLEESIREISRRQKILPIKGHHHFDHITDNKKQHEEGYKKYKGDITAYICGTLKERIIQNQKDGKKFQSNLNDLKGKLVTQEFNGGTVSQGAANPFIERLNEDLDNYVAALALDPKLSKEEKNRIHKNLKFLGYDDAAAVFKKTRQYSERVLPKKIDDLLDTYRQNRTDTLDKLDQQIRQLQAMRLDIKGKNAEEKRTRTEMQKHSSPLDSLYWYAVDDEIIQTLKAIENSKDKDGNNNTLPKKQKELLSSATENKDKQKQYLEETLGIKFNDAGKPDTPAYDHIESYLKARNIHEHIQNRINNDENQVLLPNIAQDSELAQHAFYNPTTGNNNTQTLYTILEETTLLAYQIRSLDHQIEAQQRALDELPTFKPVQMSGDSQERNLTPKWAQKKIYDLKGNQYTNKEIAKTKTTLTENLGKLEHLKSKKQAKLKTLEPQIKAVPEAEITALRKLQKTNAENTKAHAKAQLHHEQATYVYDFTQNPNNPTQTPQTITEQHLTTAIDAISETHTNLSQAHVYDGNKIIENVEGTAANPESKNSHLKNLYATQNPTGSTPTNTIIKDTILKQVETNGESIASGTITRIFDSSKFGEAANAILGEEQCTKATTNPKANKRIDNIRDNLYQLRYGDALATYSTKQLDSIDGNQDIISNIENHAGIHIELKPTTRDNVQGVNTSAQHDTNQPIIIHCLGADGQHKQIQLQRSQAENEDNKNTSENDKLFDNLAKLKSVESETGVTPLATPLMPDLCKHIEANGGIAPSGPGGDNHLATVADMNQVNKCINNIEADIFALHQMAYLKGKTATDGANDRFHESLEEAAKKKKFLSAIDSPEQQGNLMQLMHNIDKIGSNLGDKIARSRAGYSAEAQLTEGVCHVTYTVESTDINGSSKKHRIPKNQQRYEKRVLCDKDGNPVNISIKEWKELVHEYNKNHPNQNVTYETISPNRLRIKVNSGGIENVLYWMVRAHEQINQDKPEVTTYTMGKTDSEIAQEKKRQEQGQTEKNEGTTHAHQLSDPMKVTPGPGASSAA